MAKRAAALAIHFEPLLNFVHHFEYAQRHRAEYDRAMALLLAGPSIETAKGSK
jgi:hypothetical protein